MVGETLGNHSLIIKCRQYYRLNTMQYQLCFLGGRPTRARGHTGIAQRLQRILIFRASGKHPDAKIVYFKSSEAAG